MSKALLTLGGVLNSIAFVFHLLLGYQIHQLSQVAPPYRAIMQALNGGVALFVFSFAYVSLFHGKELVETGLGRVVLEVAAALYLSRAAEEFLLFEFTPLLFGACVFTGAIYAALFAIALREKNRPESGAKTPHPAA